jgi:GNAT superfamily N-acetyltransferase
MAGSTQGDAWEMAHAAAAHGGVTLRPLTGTADAAAILEVMIATWGNHQLLPAEVIVALAEAGNVPFGAMDGPALIGYVLGWAGIDPQDGVHMHSHMLAVLPDRRHRGVGYALKLAQRAQCLDQGINVVRWTFDPMIARNAWLNLGKLGALADRFHRDFYGPMSDTLNAGERSDRLVVRWELDRRPEVRAARHGDVWLTVPREYPSLRVDDPAQAIVERDRIAAGLETAFAEGLVVAGFDPQAGAYALAAREDVAP